MKALRQVCCFMLIAAVIDPTILNAGAVDISNLNWDRLHAGEVIIQSTENRDKIPGIRLFFTVAAPRAIIWKVLIDYQNFPRIFKGTKSAEVKEQDTSGVDVEINYSNNIIGLITVTYTYVLRREYKIPGELLTWHRKSGDFNAIEGSWQILDTDRQDSFLLIYESYLDGSWLFPARLVREIAIKEAVAMVKHIRHWMECKAR